MGAACSSCQQTVQQQELIIRRSTKMQISWDHFIQRESKKSMIQSSRYKKMPSKQQTLLPIQNEVAQEVDPDQQWFENQFISFPKTATFKSNTHSERMQQLQSFQQDENLARQPKIPDIIPQIVKEPPINIPPNSAPIPAESISVAQSSPYQMFSQPIIPERKDNEHQAAISAQMLTPKQNQKVPEVSQKPPKILDRSQTPNNEIKKKPDLSEVQSMKGEGTPKKSILKNKNVKGSQFSRAKSLYQRDKSIENQSNKSIQTSKSKKVKFDPRSIKEKHQNFMFV